MRGINVLIAVTLASMVGCADDEAVEDAKKWYQPWFIQNGADMNPMAERAAVAPDEAESSAVAGADAAPAVAVEPVAEPDAGPVADGRVVTIKVKRGETLKLYSTWSKIPVAELRDMNDMRKRGLRIGAAFKLRLDPKGYRSFTESRSEYFSNQEKRFFARWGVARLARYTVRKGDNVWRIAKRHDRLPVWVLEKFNGNINLSRLKVGEELLVPILTELSEPGGTAAKKLWAKGGGAKPQSATAKGKKAKRRPTLDPTVGFTVTVSKRETLGRYANWSGVSVKDILAVNPGLRKNVIVLGQKVFVPVPDARLARFFKLRRKFNGTPPPARIAGIRDSKPPAAGRKPRRAARSRAAKRARSQRMTTHRVAPGETAWVIAVKRYKIGLAALKSANPNKDLTRLRVGDLLRIPRSSRPGGSGGHRAP